MLYPDFYDLMALKSRKLGREQASLKAVKAITPGNHHSPFRGQGLEFDSVREYAFGDDIRTIDWRVTARTGSPHVRLFKEERERQIALCVDMNAAMRFGTRNTFKSVQAAQVAAVLGWQGLAQHDRVSGCLFGDVPDGLQFFAPTRTRKSFSAMLKMLAEPPAQQHDIGLEKILGHVYLTVRPGSLIYFISDFMNLSESLLAEGTLHRLCKKCDVVFIAINDPADRALYPLGLLGFCASLGEKFFANTSSRSGSDVYAGQWRENRRILSDMTSALKIPIIELTTSSEVPRDLIQGLKSISMRKRL